MPISTLANVSSRYGAPMGRPGSYGRADDGARFYLRRVRLNGGGYDSGGAYWGGGEPLWRYESEDGAVSDHIRAPNRDAARAEVRKAHPGARFFDQAGAWIIWAPYSLDAGKVGQADATRSGWAIECRTLGGAVRRLAGAISRANRRRPDAADAASAWGGPNGRDGIGTIGVGGGYIGIVLDDSESGFPFLALNDARRLLRDGKREAPDHAKA